MDPIEIMKRAKQTDKLTEEIVKELGKFNMVDMSTAIDKLKNVQTSNNNMIEDENPNMVTMSKEISEESKPQKTKRTTIQIDMATLNMLKQSKGIMSWDEYLRMLHKQTMF